MKKIFTLLAAATLTLSASAEVIYSWESAGPEAVTEVGGKITAKVDDARVNYPNTAKDVTYYTICLSGKKATYPESAYVNVALDQPLAEGDVISVTAYRNKNDLGKNVTVEFLFDGSTENTLASTEQFPNINADGENDDAPGTQTFTVPASAAGVKSFDMTRGSASTNLFITKLEITRGGSGSEPTEPAEGEKFAINGNGRYTWGKSFEDYYTPFEFNAEAKTVTLKNFLGGSATVELKYELADPNKDPEMTGTKFNSTPVAGLSEPEVVSGYSMCKINDFTGSIILKQDGVNFGKMDNITLAVGFGSQIDIMMDESVTPAEKVFNFTFMLGGDFSTWDAEKAEWVATGKTDYIQLVKNVPFTGGTSAIEAIEAADENAPVEYFNIQGMRLNEPAAGQIVIRRQGSKVSKVIIR